MVCYAWHFIHPCYCVAASCVSSANTLRDQNNLPPKFIITRAIFTPSREPISIKKFSDVVVFCSYTFGSSVHTILHTFRHSSLYVSSFRLPLFWTLVSNDSCRFSVDPFAKRICAFFNRVHSHKLRATIFGSNFNIVVNGVYCVTAKRDSLRKKNILAI